MKDVYISILKQTGLRLGLVAVAALMGVLLMFAINVPFHEMIFITKNQNYFWFNGMRIACLAFIPLLAYGIIIIPIAAFSKAHRSPKKMDVFGDIFAIICMVIFTLLSVTTLFLYFYIILFTSFKPCKQARLNDYYVIDYKLCATFEAHAIY